MRYSIMGATVQQVRAAGGASIKPASSISVIFAELTSAQVFQLRSQGCTVTPVQEVQASVRPPLPIAGLPTYTPAELTLVAGLEEIRKAMSPPLYGEGFNIAIVGSGIRRTHQLIKGRVVYAKNFTISPDGDQWDHDTGVASIALAVAPKCGLLDLKVLDSRGNGTEEEVVLAVEECIDLHEQGSEYAPTVINLSLGSADDGNPDNVMRVACRAAIEKKIWVSAACGNGGPSPGTILSPACEKYVFATGSAKYLPDQKSFVVSNFSSRGPTREGLVKPDCIAFGEDLEVASSVSDAATTAKSGTSFATPFNSGVAILYHEGVLRYTAVTPPMRFPGWVPAGELLPLVTMEDLVDRWLRTFCLKPTSASSIKDNDYGEGLVFGPLVLQSAQAMLRPAFDVSSLLSMMMVIPVIGIVAKVAAGESK